MDTDPDVGARAPASALADPLGPVQVLTELDPKAALIIVAGMAVLGSAAVFSTYTISPAAAGRIAITIIGFGALVLIVGRIVQDSLMARVLGLFLVLLVILITTCLAWSAIAPDTLIAKPTYCVIQPFSDCRASSQRCISTTAA